MKNILLFFLINFGIFSIKDKLKVLPIMELNIKKIENNKKVSRILKKDKDKPSKKLKKYNKKKSIINKIFKLKNLQKKVEKLNKKNSNLAKKFIYNKMLLTEIKLNIDKTKIHKINFKINKIKKILKKNNNSSILKKYIKNNIDKQKKKLNKYLKNKTIWEDRKKKIMTICEMVLTNENSCNLKFDLSKKKINNKNIFSLLINNKFKNDDQLIINPLSEGMDKTEKKENKSWISDQNIYLKNQFNNDSNYHYHLGRDILGNFILNSNKFGLNNNLINKPFKNSFRFSQNKIIQDHINPSFEHHYAFNYNNSINNNLSRNYDEDEEDEEKKNHLDKYYYKLKYSKKFDKNKNKFPFNNNIDFHSSEMKNSVSNSSNKKIMIKKYKKINKKVQKSLFDMIDKNLLKSKTQKKNNFYIKLNKLLYDYKIDKDELKNYIAKN